MITVESKNIVENWLSLISNASNELIRLNTVSEEDFIKIGEDFQNYYYKSKEISTLSSTISEILSSNEIKSTIEKLQLLLGKLNEFSKDSDVLSEKAENTLRKIRGSINDIYHQLDGFKRSVKHLNILGISIRIEDANLSTERTEFHILADEVTKLGEVIRNKLDTTAKKSEELDREILGTLDNVSKLRNNQDTRNDFILESINKSLDELLNKQSNSFQLAEKISASSDNILKQTGDIVSAIQFQDITRQQIEHVIKAFEELEKHVNIETQGEMLSEQNPRIMGLFNDVCRVQLGQVEQAKKSIISASDSIKYGLKGLSELTDAFTTETSKLAGLSGDSNSTVLSEIEEKIKAVNGTLKESTSSNLDLVNAVSSSVKTIEQISTYLNDIKNTGMDIEMISLNAIIKTAKLGKLGAALSVLASSIRDLSIDTAEQIKNIDETINGITRISNDLNEGINRKTGENDKDIEKMTIELEHLIEVASGANSRIMDMLNKLKNESGMLTNNISAALGSLKIEDQFLYSFDLVSKNLSTILEQMSKHYKNGSLEIPRYEIKGLEHNYTMESERNIHRQVFKNSDMDKSFLPANRSRNETKDNSNDNIELF